MSKIGIAISINITKIDKTKLHKGAKGVYLDTTIFIDTENADQYGNHGFISQSLPKADREAGQKGEILGNGKIIWRGDSQPQQNNDNFASAPPQQSAPVDDFDDDIPF